MCCLLGTPQINWSHNYTMLTLTNPSIVHDFFQRTNKNALPAEYLYWMLQSWNDISFWYEFYWDMFASYFSLQTGILGVGMINVNWLIYAQWSERCLPFAKLSQPCWTGKSQSHKGIKTITRCTFIFIDPWFITDHQLTELCSISMTQTFKVPFGPIAQTWKCYQIIRGNIPTFLKNLAKCLKFYLSRCAKQGCNE